MKLRRSIEYQATNGTGNKFQDYIIPRFKLKTCRNHLQIVTNRKRSLYVEMIDANIAVLTIETTIIYTTLRNHSSGKLKSSNMISNRSRNMGLISRYFCTDLVKLIYVEDIPKIVGDFQSGKSLNQIQYSSWPVLYDSAAICKLESCDRLISSLFQIKSSFCMSAYKTTALTCRFIKSISSLIGF